jgi:uncharacterized protein (DUF4415 family)
MRTRKPTTVSSWVDPDDAPHLDREWFQRAEIREGDRVIRAATHIESSAEPPAEIENLRLDADVLAYFRSAGGDWQTRINLVLRKAAGL